MNTYCVCGNLLSDERDEMCAECRQNEGRIIVELHAMKVKRDRRNAARRDRDAAYRDCGLVKVRGALGGTYWE